MRKHAVSHKPFAALLAAVVLLSTMSVFTLIGFASSALPSFSTDFTETDELTKWSGDTADFTVADSKLTSLAAWKAITFTNGDDADLLYENVQIDVTLSQTARIAFRASNLWTDRHYVEVDFGGAVMLRDSTDTNIQTADVAGLAAGTNANVRIKIIGNKVTVLVNDTVVIDSVTAPDLAANGYIGLIVSTSNVSFDKFAITPLDVDDLKPVVPGKNISHYFTDFDDANELDNKWLSPSELKIESGKLAAQNAVAGALLEPAEYKNFEIETVIDNDARLVFRADDIVIWTANRFYVEVDFADSGEDAIFVRDSKDESKNLKVVELPGETLTPGTPIRVRVRAIGSKIQVFLGKNAEPVLEYENEQIEARSGYTGVMVINLPTKFDYYMVTELNDNGEPVKVEIDPGTVSSEESNKPADTTVSETSTVNKPADTGESATGMLVLCLIAVFGSVVTVLLTVYKKQNEK